MNCLVTMDLFLLLRVPAGPNLPGHQSTPVMTGAAQPTPQMATPTSDQVNTEDVSIPPQTQASLPRGRSLETLPTNVSTFSADQFSPSGEPIRRNTIAHTGDTEEPLTESELRLRRLQRFNSEPTPVLHSIEEEQHANSHVNEQTSKSPETHSDNVDNHDNSEHRQSDTVQD